MADLTPDQEHALLLASFASDTDANLAAMEQALLLLEQDPSDGEQVRSIFRAVHSIKGDASIVGFARLTEVVHGVEDLLDSVREGGVPVTSELCTWLLAVVDALRVMVPAALDGNERVSAQHQRLFARLAAFDGSGTASPAAAAPIVTAASASAGIRVDMAKLDRLLTVAGEMAIARRRLGALLPPGAARDVHAELDRLSLALQDEIVRARMIPIGPLFGHYARTVRDLAASQGKKARLAVEGSDVEVDAALLEPLRDCLTHMIRNAIDHGLEPPAKRLACGKPDAGTITLSARHDADRLIISLSDDGAGFRRDRIIARARREGIVPEQLSEDELLKLALAPGFSTAEQVTELSGRGVGLDVVQKKITSLRGSVRIESTEGRGSRLTVKVPLTLALIEGFYVAVGESTYVIPLSAVRELIELPRTESTTSAQGVLHMRGEPLPFVRLRELFGVHGVARARETVVVVRHEGRQAGLVVEELLGESQTVVKPLGALFQGVAAVSGSTITGEGRVALILDVPAILRDVVARAERPPTLQREQTC